MKASIMKRNKKVLFCAMVIAMHGSAWSEEKKNIPVVPVIGSMPVDASSKSTTAANPSTGKPADGGAWMKKIPGVSGVRMGGHGVDPVVRGQKATQVNVILDGAFVHGGCPNRMDPPSSYANPAGYDLITVLKGTQSLVYGAGGPGGTVLFERSDPVFEAGKNFSGGVGAGYNSNGSARSYNADAAVGDKNRFIRAVLSRQVAGNYQDGDNVDVRSAYREKAATLDMAYKPTNDSRLGLTVEARRGSDILFAGAGMDSPIADNDMIKLSYKNDGGTGYFSSSKVELYKSSVYHVMDNYSLRPAGMMKARVPSDSDTLGGRVIGEHAMSKGVLTLGIDVQNNDRDATRFAGMMAPTAIPYSHTFGRMLV
jgi:iron complex outermembrane receptor protein